MLDSREIELINVLKIVAPGTPLREGLENVLKAKTGALIMVGDQKEVMGIIDGGFFINSEYSPSYLYELAKMDGAIVLSSDLKKILYANTQLIPDSSIETFETGTRHRTADRVAKQTGNLVIAISQRRNIITIYKGNLKYILKDTNIILTKANQAIQTLERYKTVLDEAMTNLSVLEFDDLVTVYDVVLTVQRNEMVMRIVNEIQKYIYELGNEGRLISMQLDDLVDEVENDGIMLIKDYSYQKDYNDILKGIRNLSSDELLELSSVCKIFGYNADLMLDTMISPKGYRLISKIPKVPSVVIENLVKTFGQLKNVMKASIEELDNVEGIGEARARAIKEGLRKLQEKVLLNRHI
ncbi:DNA integrity scanning protein DisA [Caloramator sp. E03]|uniref:DNA integrity scanning diadenylate cyclase DisA n=1 Tax=Caloramator sp. E03 TaxID=2576307 RepID=UPI001110BFFB|nr:DNA integrity scanning diadenylate cyclase DisA [Caloramator sp. E03]QCX33806.1 DNA integrity scanning protein DisA [Caloramator sp. E03]